MAEKTQEISNYKIKKEIGEGGMARVYLAFEKKLQRPVALKVLLPGYAASSRVTRRFLKEARIAAQLRHSNIVSIYDVGKQGDYFYIAMEYLRESLKKRLRQVSSLKPQEALFIVKEVAKALAYAHKQGYIHRDIKPDNIMFRDDGAVVLVDFGIVKAIKSNTKLTRTGVSVGTPSYMSPEQVKGQRVDERSDIYSLGIVLYELLLGQVPYKSDDVVSLAVKHVEAPIPELPNRLKKYQPLLDKMLAKKPKDRVRTADGLIRLIDALNYKLKIELEEAIRPQVRRSRKKKLLVGYLVTALVVAALTYGSCHLLRNAQDRNEPAGLGNYIP